MSKVPGSGSEPDEVEVVDYRGYRMRVEKVRAGWSTYVSHSDGRPTALVDDSRDGSIAQARAWVDERVEPKKSLHSGPSE